MFRLLNVVLLNIIMVFFIICASGVDSFARENTDVKATQTEKYIRLFFYCKQPISFTTSLKGNKLKVSFGRDVEINAGNIKAAANDISDVGFNEKNNTATITLASSSYSVRKFIGEDFIGLDIIKPEKSANNTPKENEPKEDIAKQEQTAVNSESKDDAQENDLASLEPAAGQPEPVADIVKVKAAIAKPTPIERAFIPTPKLREVKLNKVFVQTAANDADLATPVAKPQDKPVEPAAPAKTNPAEQAKAVAPVASPAAPVAPAVEPAAKVENVPAKVENAASQKPATALPETAKTETKEKPADNAVNKTQSEATIKTKVDNADAAVVPGNSAPKAVTQPAPATAAVAPASSEKDVAGDDTDSDAENVEAPIKSVAEIVKDKLLSKIAFEWDTQVAASIFNRAGYLWVVFDKSKEINVKNIVSKNPEYFVSGSQMPNRFYTILRFKLKKDLNSVAYKENNNWVVGILSEKMEPAKSSKVEMKFSDLTGSKVLLDNDSPIKPLRLIDEEVGDEIVILPYLEESTGVKEKYKYVDFTFLETSQGAAIQLISDKVEVAVSDTGVSVVGPANIIDNEAQSALKALKEKEEEARLGAEKLKQKGAELSLIKFNTWMIGDDSSYKKDLKELEWKITEVDWSEKGKYRLALARFYLANGLAAEALSVIRVLREFDDKLGKENDVKVVEATALYMMGQYKEAIDVYDSINKDAMTVSNKNEILFWRTAADINIGNQIKLDKFITKNPLKNQEAEEEVGGDKVENTKLMHDTSMRLLKMIRKMDPDFVNSDELQKLESTARFVTSHYQESIKRFEETDLFTSGDVFQAEDNKLWWSTQKSKRQESSELAFLPNIDDFLKNYPDHIFNDFNLLALEDALKKNDLVKAEEIQAFFRTEDRPIQKNSIEFFHGLYAAKNEEVDKAIEIWQKLTKEAADPYNRTRAQFALTVFQLDKKQIDVKQAIANLNSIRSSWRGDQLEFHILTLLGEFYMDTQQPMEGFKVFREAISAFPGSDESLLIAKKMSENFVKIFAQGGADKMPKIDAITLYYEFRELTPIGKLGDDMISKLVDRLIDVDLLERAAALLTHQVRFRLVGEDRDIAATKLIKIHLINKEPQKALDVLDATENPNIKESVGSERKYLRSQALLDLGKNNKVLTLLQDDLSKNAAFLRADVYWRNNVWKKVIDELEVPFREIRRDERKLTTEETNQLIKLSVSYALLERQKRLQVLYEDFADLIDDQPKKNLLTFIATNKGPVDYKNLEQTVGYKDMENFLTEYMKSSTESGKS